MRYTESHEWCRVEDGVASVGISKHAAEELGDLTFLEYLVQVDDELEQGSPFGEVESVKATSELFAPLDGTLVALNERFADEAELPAITKDSESAECWLVKIRVADAGQLDGLMDAEAYAAHCASG